MGSWGVRSYENDDADFAIDAGFDQVHGPVYEDLMDDGNAATIDQIQQQLANSATLESAILALCREVGRNWDEWDDEQRLGFAGVVVRHAEFKVPVPNEWRSRAILWLGEESIEWEEVTARRLRKAREIELLERPESQ